MRSDAPKAPGGPLFDTAAYASTPWERVKRAFELGPKYYLLDVPRYLLQRRRLGLGVDDWPVLWNPTRSFRGAPYVGLPTPPRLDDALDELRRAGVQFDNSRLRVEALASVWWQCRGVPGQVIECGAFRGSVSLMLATLGRLHDLDQTVLMLDTFAGMPAPSSFDSSRRAGEYAPPGDWLAVLDQQIAALGLEGRVEVHAGLFHDTFARLTDRDPRFSFVHIDANIYQGTLEATEFTLPRLSPGGAVVFDDYNGLMDLGARLAIDQALRRHLGTDGPRPRPLAECSAYLRP